MKKGWSESRIEELLGLLWILTGTQLTGWWRGFFIGFGIASLIAAIYFAIKSTILTNPHKKGKV